MAEAVRPKRGKARHKDSSDVLFNRLENLEVFVDDPSVKEEQIDDQPEDVEKEESDSTQTLKNESTDTSEKCEGSKETPEQSAETTKSDEPKTSDIQETNECTDISHPAEKPSADISVEDVMTAPTPELQYVGSPELETVEPADYRMYPSLPKEEGEMERPQEPSAPIFQETTNFPEISACELPPSMPLEQLKSFYYNIILEKIDDFEDRFIQESDQSGHELWTLLSEYWTSLLRRRQSDTRLGGRTSEAGRIQGQLWTISKEKRKKEGRCCDGIIVSGEYEFERAHFSEDQRADLANCLEVIRTELSEELPLQDYSVQINCLLIEKFFYNLFMRSPLFRDLPPNAPPRLLRSGLSPNEEEQIRRFRDCLSVLFAFLRKPFTDDLFVSHLRKWTLRLGGSLLRAGSSRDHLFLLAHLLRCPSGIGQWAVGLIQPVLHPPQCQVDVFQSEVFDHALAMLGLLLRPVRERQAFLAALEIPMSPTPAGSDDQRWVMVDSEGEEDVDPAGAWHRLAEEDLIVLLDQIPVNALFSHTLQVIQEDASGQAVYEPHAPSSASLLRLIAFSDQMIGVLKTGLDTYPGTHYRGLAKRIYRMIRHTLQFLTDHLELTAGQLANPSDPEPLLRIVAQYEDLLVGSLKTLLLGKHRRPGAWQAVADCPFRLLTPRGKWRALTVVVQCGQAGDDSFREEVDISLLEDSLPELAQVDMISLLTAMGNLARECRPQIDKERYLLNNIVGALFKVCFLYPYTRELCSKVGRELLSAISLQHPHILPVLVSAVKENIDSMGNVSLYLFRDLPFHLFVPNETHILIFYDWLLNQPVTALPNQLTRVILNGLNWGACLKDPRKLFLTVDTHWNVALLLVKAFKMHTSQKQATWIVGESIKLLSSLWRTTPPSPEESFHIWCLNLIGRLRLHVTSRWDIIGYREQRDSHFHDNDQWRKILAEVKTQKNPIATYVAVVMGPWGHRLLDGFLESGLDALHVLAGKQHQYGLTIEALHQVVKMFGGEEQLMINSDKFINLIRMILHGDDSYYQVAKSLLQSEFPGPVLRTFAVMVLSTCEQARGYQHFPVDAMLRFWLRCLFSQSNWNTDNHVLYVLDRLLELTFRLKTDVDVGEQEAMAAYRTFVGNAIATKDTRRGLSAMVGYGAQLEGLVDRLDGHPWVTWYLAGAEVLWEEEIGLWSDLQNRVALQQFSGRPIYLAEVFGESLKSISFPIGYSLDRLSVYGLARAIVRTPADHPILPLTSQIFFKRFFELPKQSVSPRLDSIGMQLFGSHQATTLLKSLRIHFGVAAEHFSKCLTQDSGTQTPVNTQQTHFTKRMIEMYRTFVMWVDEPRLHLATLDLRALPTNYSANRLESARTNQTDLWLDLVDTRRVDLELSNLISPWSARHSNERNLHHLRDIKSVQNRIPVGEQIIRRLQRYAKAAGPPPMTAIKPLVHDLDLSSLADPRLTIYGLQDALSLMAQQAQVFGQQRSCHTALDADLYAVVPKLYTKRSVQKTLSIPCSAGFQIPGMGAVKACTGPAAINVQYESCFALDDVRQRIESNRSQYEQLIRAALDPIAKKIIRAVLQVEHVISLLISRYRETSGSGDTHTKIGQCGATLFYHLVKLASKEMRQWPPAWQMILRCTEMLGSEFVAPSPGQLEPLLEAIIQCPHHIDLMGRHFSPLSSPELFPQVYERVLGSASRLGLPNALALLKKFKVTDWLQTRIMSGSIQTNMIQTVCGGIRRCGAAPLDDLKKIFETHLELLEILLKHNFPQHLSLVLSAFIAAAHNSELVSSSWEIVVNALEYDRKANTELSMSIEKLQESLLWLAARFTDQRAQHPQLAENGLYTKWGCHAFSLANIFAILLDGLVFKVARSVSQGHMDERIAIDLLWTVTQRVYGPWVESFALPAACQFGQPWTNVHAADADWMLTALRDTLLHLQESFQDGESGCPVLGLMWSWYSTALTRVGLPSSVISPFHHHLNQLDWELWRVDLGGLNSMLEFYNRQSTPACREFLTTLLSRVEVSTHHSDFGFSDALFHLVVGLVTRTDILKMKEAEKLLDKVSRLDWIGLQPGNYQLVLDWFLTRADPLVVLAGRSTPEGKLVNFMEKTGGLDPNDLPSTNENRLIRQLICLRMLVTMLGQCAAQKEPPADRFSTRITNLVNQVEGVAAPMTSSEPHRPHIVEMTNICLNLLRNTSGQGQRLAQAALIGWLEGSGSSPVILPFLEATLRTPPGTKNIALIVETISRSYISAESCDSGPAAWGTLSGLFCPDGAMMEELAKECVQCGHVVCLHLIVYWYRLRCSCPEDEVNLLSRMVAWLPNIIMNESSEPAAVLVWRDILDLVIRVASVHLRTNLALRALNGLLPVLEALAEDRAGSGLLGMIGLGRRSQFSAGFRLTVRSLFCYIHAQMPTGGTQLRISDKYPGHLVPGMAVQSRPPGQILPTNQALQAVNYLIGLKQNKDYADLVGTIDFVLQFIGDEVNALPQSKILIAELIKRLFADDKLVAVIYQE